MPTLPPLQGLFLAPEDAGAAGPSTGLYSLHHAALPIPPVIKPDPHAVIDGPPNLGNIPMYNGNIPPHPGEAAAPLSVNHIIPGIKGENSQVLPLPNIPPRPPPKQVRIIELPKLFEDTSLDQLEEGVKKGTEIIEKLQNTITLDPESVRGDLKLWYEQLEDLKTNGSHHKTIIGVVGNTGAGKSSVINALLDEERLVPTNVCNGSRDKLEQ